MKFTSGRGNLALTVFVPWDCKNNCKFCTSKAEYKCKTKIGVPQLAAVISRILKSGFPIREVVFTGGEPTENMSALHELLSETEDRHVKVYVNTTLPKKNFWPALEIFNHEDYLVHGVNISRHGKTEAEDAKLLQGAVEDWALDGIEVPIKINVVLPEGEDFKPIVQAHLKRWRGKDNITVSFRKDYRYVTQQNLHLLNGDPVVEWLCENYEFEGHTFCDVCDTVSFSDGRNTFHLHRGLEHSSVKVGDTIIVNDVIVFPDGTIAYDWDKSTSPEFVDFITGKTSTPTAAPTPKRGIPASKNSYPDAGSCGGPYVSHGGHAWCGTHSRC